MRRMSMTSEEFAARLVAIVSAGILSLAAPAPLGASDATSPSLPAPQNAVRIFNGRDLDGWRIHGTELWYADVSGTATLDRYAGS